MMDESNDVGLHDDDKCLRRMKNGHNEPDIHSLRRWKWYLLFWIGFARISRWVSAVDRRPSRCFAVVNFTIGVISDSQLVYGKCVLIVNRKNISILGNEVQ